MSKKLTPLPNEVKKTKKGKGFVSVFNKSVEFLGDVFYFLFFSTAVTGGYVLFTQGALNMKVVGGVLLAGGVTYFANKTINK